MLYTEYGDTPAIHADECPSHTPDFDVWEAYQNGDGDVLAVTCTRCGSVWDEGTETYHAPRYITRNEFREAFAVDTTDYCAGRW